MQDDLPEDIELSDLEQEWSSDVIAAARKTVEKVMLGKAGGNGRNATAILNAAKFILSKDYLSQLSDEDLLAEVRRRTGPIPEGHPPKNE